MPETRNTQDGQPDPATRDLLREAWLKGSDEGAAIIQHGERHKDMHLPTFDQWYAAKFPPPLPDEPPDGTVLAGTGPNAWVRDDATGADGELLSRWWMTGKRKGHTWAEALQHGADPTRRLVELPDPRDVEAMVDLETRSYEIAQTPGLHLDDPAYVVMALAERGQP